MDPLLPESPARECSLKVQNRPLSLTAVPTIVGLDSVPYIELKICMLFESWFKKHTCPKQTGGKLSVVRQRGEPA